MIQMRYYDQKHNHYGPERTCNVTSLAMALSALGINVKPDTLYEKATSLGLEVTEVGTLTRLAALYGVRDEFTSQGSFGDIRKALDLGRPVLLRGYFTSSGHVIAVYGYDKWGLWVNDPWGEWFARGYDTKLTGEKLHYSWGLIGRTCAVDTPASNPGDIWFHQLYK